MTTEELVEILGNHRTIGKAPREELSWIATHGELQRFQPGEIVASRSQIVHSLYIVLSGRLSHHLDRGTGRRKVMEWVGGDVTGMLPYSRMTTAQGESIIDEPTEVLRISRDDIPELIRNCYEVTAILVHVMTDRARRFTSADLRDEKLISLGKLASGLAHELNNPASAVTRNAKFLAEALSEGEEAARGLAMAGLTADQWKELDAVRNPVLTSVPQPHPSGLALADREEDLAEWLQEHGLDDISAEELARTTLTIEALDRLARAIHGDLLGVALRWIAAGANARSLTDNIGRASTRIHTLVDSVRRFTHMDRAPVAEDVEISKGIEDTVVILGDKARGKSVAVTLDVPPGLPRVRGVAAEINQIWMNLIDNAIDAAPSNGHVNVTATQEGAQVVVRVVDDGPGIPEDILGNIFDPFFTTKSVGEGTGLGLEIVRRMVQWHNGEIDVDSRAGRTEFCVKLPLAGRKEIEGSS
jgi:signal transduction histidine kinase